MDTVELTQELIKKPSVTPDDAGCQKLLGQILQAAGFVVDELNFGEVRNLWAVHGSGAPLFCFLGHTDVVPTGPLNDWKHPPFAAQIEDEILYGRGAADMKGGVAAFVIAALDHLKEHPDHKGTLALLLTSDEEGPAVDGTQAVLKELEKREAKIDYCLVGEPSSEEKLGDVIKNGRRGSLGGKLVINGIQGHVAYPQLARNPIHEAVAALSELCRQRWDEGNDFFPPTSFQISNIHAGTGADNVIPGRLELAFNFRFSSAVTPEFLRGSVEEILRKHQLDYSIDWRLSGSPFITTQGNLLKALRAAIEDETGAKPRLSTAGGTSDGRFVAPTGAEVVEFGPVNRSIHKVDECVRVEDLQAVTRIYRRILDILLV